MAADGALALSAVAQVPTRQTTVSKRAPRPCLLIGHLLSCKTLVALCCPLSLAEHTLKNTSLARLSHFPPAETEFQRSRVVGLSPTASLKLYLPTHLYLQHFT